MLQQGENATEGTVSFVLQNMVDHWAKQEHAQQFHLSVAWKTCPCHAVVKGPHLEKCMYLPQGPSRRHFLRGFVWLLFKVSTSVWTLCRICACLGPHSSIPFNLWFQNWMSKLARCTAVTFLWQAHTKHQSSSEATTTTQIFTGCQHKTTQKGK